MILSMTASLQLRPVLADDLEAVTAYADIVNAVRAADVPWEHRTTVAERVGVLRWGWDLAPYQVFLVHDGERDVAVGQYAVSVWDNFHLAWVDVLVHPDHRRRGIGTYLYDALAAHARAEGRTSIGTSSWDAPGPRAFAAAQGLELKTQEILRRQHLAELDRAELDRLWEDALPHASAYELVRLMDPLPEEDLDAMAVMTAAINDAPMGSLDIEDEVFDARRLRAVEEAHRLRNLRVYRVNARHRETGAWVGESVVAVDGEQPQIASQYATSVVRAHRGHRLGLLLKLDMLLWLAQAEPGLETIDTMNAEVNAHMIGVNELLGYRVLDRELAFQRDL